MAEIPELKQIVEGAILAADQPLSIDRLMQLFSGNPPERSEIRDALTKIQQECDGRGFELKEVASGFRFQVRTSYGHWVSRLWEEKPPRYTRALLETLALVAYKQPLTRGDIEEIRGVSVSTNIIRSLQEREWIRVVGHRDVPGRPALYATTRTFLDYFNLSGLDELPTLSDIRDLDKVNEQLELVEEPDQGRSIELDLAANQIDSDLAEDESEEDDLEEVTSRVNEIQENIRGMFRSEQDEDEDEDEDENENLLEDQVDAEDREHLKEEVHAEDEEIVEGEMRAEDEEPEEPVENKMHAKDEEIVEDEMHSEDEEPVEDEVHAEDEEIDELKEIESGDSPDEAQPVESIVDTGEDSWHQQAVGENLITGDEEKTDNHPGSEQPNDESSVEHNSFDDSKASG